MSVRDHAASTPRPAGDGRGEASDVLTLTRLPISWAAY